MPELPEVQTVVTQLEKKVSNKKIVDFWSGWPKKVMPDVKTFQKRYYGYTDRRLQTYRKAYRN